MTKQEFIELFEVVQQYHEQSRELGEMLHKIHRRKVKVCPYCGKDDYLCEIKSGNGKTK